MKQLIFSAIIFLSSQAAWAQEPDTLQTTPAQPAEPIAPPEEPKPVAPEAVTELPKEPKEVTKPDNVSTAEPTEIQPKIIYYQSSSDQDRKSRRKRGRGDIKTLSGSMNHSGGFGALSFRTTDFNDETLVMAGIRGGWIINRTLGIGLEGHGIIPTAKFDGIDPNNPENDFHILGGYGGMFLELIFFSNQVVHVTFPVSAGAGWLGYDRLDDATNFPQSGGDIGTDDIVDEDVFWYAEPGANLEVNLARNFRMDFGASRRFTQDLELANTKSSAFEKWNYYITLKIGGF
ncbi:MAG: hypothetical protein KI790_11860 [Cyclobacteriaceae bacterium]|nr:hypothetical protein [Cyclobacteriaceae bacterium HetDA_MAG_MS6]